jgi:hypothetical protein
MSTAMVIRTLYNNRDWQAPCNRPFEDSECRLCFKPNVAIRPPKVGDEICSGHCWERSICTKYYWGCPPPGRRFGGRAQIGTQVFLVYRQPNGGYTLWGKTTVQSIDKDVVRNGIDGEDGFAFIHFRPFKPLQKDKRIKDLTDLELVGERWLMGTFRYIDSTLEKYLEKLTAEGKTSEQVVQLPTGASPDTAALSVKVMPNIREKLNKASEKEGRQTDEIIREAVAEWLRDRGL